jgi:hypothetical protein
MGRAEYGPFASSAREGALCALIVVREHAARPWCREKALPQLFVTDLPREHSQRLRR